MSFDATKVDRILQYSLLCAGEEEDLSDRLLGPIHLLKYVYLADLAYAERNDGVPYTGIRWTFYRFGPWSPAVHARLEPALCAIHADRRVFESDVEDRNDWIRWWKRDEYLLAQVQAEIPISIASRLKFEVRRFGKDTRGLLDHVYKTAPMLHAAPGEPLAFSIVVKEDSPVNPSVSPSYENLSEKKKKKLREQLRTLRTNRKTRNGRSDGWVEPPKPRYDAVYERGTAWLDELAGPSLPEGERVVEFSDAVWKSLTRQDHDVS